MLTGDREPLSVRKFAAGAIAILLLGFAAVEWSYGWTTLGWQFNHGDLTIYTDATRRLLTGGSWYLDRQLHGPYPLEFGDVLYPPVSALFFAPWLILPGWTFVAIPAAIVIGYVFVQRPSLLGWWVIAFCLLWPATGIKVLSANPNVWVAAFVALGLRFAWPGALVLLKPSFLPVALIGIRSRGWWVTVGVLAALSLPWIRETLTYPSVVLNVQGPGLLYSAVDLPTVLIPVVALLTGQTKKDRPRLLAAPVPWSANGVAALGVAQKPEGEDERALGRRWRRGDGLGDLHVERAGHGAVLRRGVDGGRAH